MRDSFRILGSIGMKYMSGYLNPLKEEIVKSNLNILFEIYVGKMLTFSILAFFSSFAFVTVMFTIFGAPLLLTIIGGVIAGSATSFAFLPVPPSDIKEKQHKCQHAICHKPHGRDLG